MSKLDKSRKLGFLVLPLFALSGLVISGPAQGAITSYSSRGDAAKQTSISFGPSVESEITADQIDLDPLESTSTDASPTDSSVSLSSLETRSSATPPPSKLDDSYLALPNASSSTSASNLLTKTSAENSTREEKSATAPSPVTEDEETVSFQPDAYEEANYRDFITRAEFESEVSKLSWKKGPFTFTPYGFVWVNCAWNSSRCVTDPFCLYAISDGVDDTAGAAVDARTSRFGMMIDGPGFPGNPNIKLKGVFEADFQGNVNSTRNKGELQLRKAFVEVSDPKREWKFEFGQDWDTISPLAPQMLNYLPAGFAGNIGYRRCQMRLEKDFTHSGNLKTIWQIGLADPFPGDFTSLSSVSAEAGGWPQLQGRTAVQLGESARGGLPITLGVSGHVGEETYRFSPIAGTIAKTSEVEHIQSWSVNGEADIPINQNFRIQGEYFIGRDLSTFCGGINQGVDLYLRDGVRAQGFWASLHSKLTEKLTNNTGYAIDQPFKEDLAGTSMATNGKSSIRTENALIFSNLLYQWNKALMTGVEFGYWKTKYEQTDVSTENIQYLPMAAGTNYRVDFAVQYLF